MKIHHFTVEEALASLESRPQGLTTAEAARRLLEFGPNRVEEVRGQPMVRRFLKGFTHFFAIIVMQVANVFLCRSRRDSAFRFGLFRNPLLLLGIVVELTLILLIDYTPWGNTVFRTAPIPLAVWLFVVPFALGMLLLEEARKWIDRAKGSEMRGQPKNSADTTCRFRSATTPFHEHIKV